MDVRTQIAAIEDALRPRRVSVASLCRKADLAPTTWVRWKAGVPTRKSSWDRVLAALAEIDPALAKLGSVEGDRMKGEAA